MLVWILYLQQDNGAVLSKPFTTPRELLEFVSTLINTGFQSTFPGEPKVGDYAYLRSASKDIGYAVLGQVRFN